MSLRFFEDTVAAQSHIEEVIKKFGWAAEHNYYWYQYYQHYYNPPQRNIFVEADNGALLTAFDEEDNSYFVVFDPMAAPEHRAALLAEYIDWIFSHTSSESIWFQLELPTRRELMHILPERYLCRRIYYTLIWPIYSLDTFDPALPGGHYKSLRKEVHKFYREHRVAVEDAKTFEDKQSLHAVVDGWKKARTHHDMAMTGVYHQIVDAGFKGMDEARVFIVDGKPVGFNAGWRIPNKDCFYGGVGINDYSIEDLGTMLYLEDLVWLKNHGYRETDMGGTEKASLPFKKKIWADVVLFVTEEALSVDLAWKIKGEGNEVKFYIGREDDQDVGEGFWRNATIGKRRSLGRMSSCLTMSYLGRRWFRKAGGRTACEGKLVVGGSEYTDRLETDREFGQQEMKAVGMLVLPHWDFDNFGDAIEFLKTNPGRYIFKPSEGDLDWHVKNLLFIAQEEDGKDLLEVLEHNRKSWSRKIKRFQFQKVASGVEIAVGAFFNGNDFITPINVNFEHKKLFPGDIGPATPEMGTLMFWEEPNGFFNATLAKMTEKLRASKYVGYIDINCIANGKGIYPLEFTARFGYPTSRSTWKAFRARWVNFYTRSRKARHIRCARKKGSRSASSSRRRRSRTAMTKCSRSIKTPRSCSSVQLRWHPSRRREND
jgi:hypothetical protein